MTKKEEEKCNEIAEHYGLEVETDKAIEEMAELIQALVKDYHKSNPNMYEELADVTICLHHLTYFYGRDLINKNVSEKIKRQLERMRLENDD